MGVWEGKFLSACNFVMFLFATGWHPERRRLDGLKNALIWNEIQSFALAELHLCSM